MDEQNEPPPPKRRRRWPLFLLGAVLLGAVLSVLWMSVAVRRIEQWRDPNSPPPVNGSSPR